MKKYNINVNGKSYEVEVEEISTDVTDGKSNVPFEKEQVVSSQPIPEFKEQALSKDVEMINAPMPGSIFDVRVAVGDMVSEGDVLLILEAMKMENEIMAPRDGKILSIDTSKGQVVSTGDPLISLG